jgi:hypothetical protein
MRYMILIYSEEIELGRRESRAHRRNHGRLHAYTDKLRAAGVYVAGDELNVVATAKSIRGAGGSQVVDGPFVDTKEALGGYYLIDCATEDEALKWAKQCPVTMHGGGVELRPIMVR